MGGACLLKSQGLVGTNPVESAGESHGLVGTNLLDCR